MAFMDGDHAGLVVAAQAGDDRAREELIAAYLPLLYNIVGRALSGHADVDDVVQETLLRVVRDLPALRAPESFRSWLVSITLRQINTHWHRQRTFADRTTVIDEARQIPDLRAEPEDVTILRLHVSDERRQAVEAARWLDPDHRMLLSLWWQECAGSLSRADIAAATGLTVAHVGVRLQRMREQLEVSRTIVAALEADPRCPQLDETVVGWDGLRTSVWRKRIARHTRDCPLCTATTAERVPSERLLVSLTPLAVPAALISALAAKGLLSGTAASTTGLATASVAVGTATEAAGVHTSLIGKLYAATAHPLAGLTTGAVLIAGGAAYVAWPEPAPRVPGVTAAPTAGHSTPAGPSPASPSATADAVPLGAHSLESVDQPALYLTYAGDFATLGPVSSAGSAQARQRVTFTVVRGLADTRCVTFRAADGRYLRHHYLRLRLSTDDGSELFREDATFCARPGAVAGSVTLHAHNYPGSVIRHRDGGIFLDGSDGTKAFAGQASFIVRRAWA
ncbi:RNA polymerase ECF-subfamily sigma factor [Streptomyces lincolnensis]|uniref:RNA polymerase ECF-subfamily sigma factor n=2 Tax=Streptomyces lincolnensis TaxID=1915 RepID=A0A1B1MDP7_STRLN|nr:sigma-70 family RNA polymerase sigma factor [Streptomyces lincolnensis]ANS66750.1 RNA polymerase ECF-subfamily sigma factor [Streptomyces lincolnensis]AXG55621.1 RNA polymerase ECF-subfamily sigma factor [Streptomyces lincolnensis]QMV07897.1 sigma-70 family RNA polymerase sigma factor [Streptomyces lincolnensis]